MIEAAEKVIDNVIKMSIKATSIDQLKQIATISANGDQNTAELITAVLSKLGPHGTVTIEKDSKQQESSVNFIEGIEIDYGTISPQLILDKIKGESIYIDPYVLLYDDKISNMDNILPFLEFVAQRDKPLIIVCSDMTDDVLTALMTNHAEKNLKLNIVKSPAFENKRLNRLVDIEVFSNGKTLDDFMIEKVNILQDKTPEQVLGKCSKVIINQKQTILLGGKGNTKLI